MRWTEIITKEVHLQKKKEKKRSRLVMMTLSEGCDSCRHVVVLSVNFKEARVHVCESLGEDIYSWNQLFLLNMSEVLIGKPHERSRSLFRDVQSGFSLGLCLRSVFPRCTTHPHKDVKPCKQTHLKFQSIIFWHPEKFPFPFSWVVTSHNYYDCGFTGKQNKKTLHFCISLPPRLCHDFKATLVLTLTMLW